MRFLDRLERVFGRFALPHLSLFIVIAQVCVFTGEWFRRVSAESIVLVPALVTEQGEWWRLVTFMAQPPPVSFLFIAFSWWLFFMMGSALEEYWGDFRFNLFILTGYLLTVGVSFLQPIQLVDNVALYGTVFLAFAYINPDFEMMIFFILPVKVRWLALLTWFGYGYEIVVGTWPVRLRILAAVGNVLLFFGRDVFVGLSASRRRVAWKAKAKAAAADSGARHTCRICKKTNLTDPQMDFRYCSQCEGDDCCYCMDHLHNHVHVKLGETKAP